jgi:hypothetical protein
MKRSGPIARKTPLARGQAMKRTSFKRKAHKPTDDPAHLEWVRAQPCCVCGTTVDVEAHHSTVSKGMSLKTSDRDAFPMCAQHHKDEFHRHRGFFDGWTKAQRKEWQLAMSAKYAPEGQTV